MKARELYMNHYPAALFNYLTSEKQVLMTTNNSNTTQLKRVDKISQKPKNLLV